MDVTSILNGFAGGKMDKNTLNALAGCCSGKDGYNPIIWIILLLLFCNGGFGGNNNCGGNNGYGNCNGYGNYNLNPSSPYYTYYDPCCCQSSKKSKNDCDLYYMQPIGGNYCMPQNYNNNNCNGGWNNSWWIWIIIILLFSGWGNNRGFLGINSCSTPSPRVKEENYSNRNEQCDSCEEVDFTD